jgi:UDP-2-acetamido-2,6-beta-L-arabino-hexul-4-ose reductase
MKLKIYEVKKHADHRGWLCEILREDLIRNKIAQIHVSLSKKGILRGGHYHKRKFEWFSVIRGRARFYFKNLKSGQEREIELSGDDLRVIEVPPFVHHKVQSLTQNMLFLVGVNEVYDENDSDTFS